MYLFRILISSLFVFLASAAPRSDPLSTTPRLVKIFNSMAKLGDFNAPIPLPGGGQRIVASVVGGSIQAVGDRAVTGTFKGGISVIDIINGGAAIVNNVQTFGSTANGTAFLITESGVGSPSDDFARLTIDAGGKYAPLRNQFIITEAVLAVDRKSVMTVGYLVTD
ncbi:MAG: hypothetical protein L6R37_000813 [Teloschistes peruensis]|nr:MAG: hypothetical protein L6R37_000813 [Teloschistes peruensis]